ncbi:MAG: hypothetical protein KKE50_04715 [Nanoarchaeota archaeon]|nr:hypothetical protein [Nanoarchaeota archaeon]
MIVKILGIFDMLAALLFWVFGIFGIIPSNLILILAVYLLVKGLIFVISADVASVIDILVSLIMFLSLSFHIPQIIVITATLILIQKGAFSLFA